MRAALLLMCAACGDWSPYEGAPETGGSQQCHGAVQTTVNIIADGDPADWGGILPMLDDPEGDDTFRSGDDLDALYAAINDQSLLLYLRVDLYEPANQNFRNGSSGFEGRYEFFDIGQQPRGFSVVYDGANNNWTALPQDPDITVGVQGNTIEVHLPLNGAGSGDVTGMRVGFEVCNANCQEFDVMTCVD